MNFYNEWDKSAAAWLRELISAGELSEGTVDERDIQAIGGVDFTEYTRCHFFAGIGGWDYALRLAGWPDNRPVWTASLPCQPFSHAGKQRGHEDERHLWPIFRNFVEEYRPTVCFGEQVASKLGRAWLSSVRVEMEALGYAIGTADLCAAGISAPHIRQRLYWVAVSGYGSEEGRGLCRSGEGVVQGERRASSELERSSSVGGLGHTEQLGTRRNPGTGVEAQGGSSVRAERDDAGSSGTVDSLWDDVVYITCADGKARPLPRATQSSSIEMAPRFPPLVVRSGDQSAQGNPDDSSEARVMRLKGYGNTIVPQLAAIFIRSAMEAMGETTR